MKTEFTRVLSADIYDAIELSARAYGGIGAGSWDRSEDGERVPFCVHGHADFICGDASALDVKRVLYAAGISLGANDRAVERVNIRKGVYLRDRISFEEWTAELNVVRGE